MAAPIDVGRAPIARPPPVGHPGHTVSNAVPHGVITGPALSGPVGLDFSPWGELFVGNGLAPGGVSRWTFDGSGAATFNGSFTTPWNVVIDVEFGPN